MRLVEMVAEEVTLHVHNSEGWDITFDKAPAKVVGWSLVGSSILLFNGFCCPEK